MGNRRVFVVMSRLMAPLIRRGLLPPTAMGGTLCVLRTRGRRSGAWREASLDVARAGDDGVWVLAGWGEATQWYQNLVADPVVEVVMGRRTRRGRAEVITDPAERLRAVRAVLLASGLAGRAAGPDARTATDAELAAAYASIPVVHVRFEPAPSPVMPRGAQDHAAGPGGDPRP